MDSRVINYKTEDDSNFTEYVLNFIFNICGYSSKKKANGNVDLYYGDKPNSVDCNLSIKRNEHDTIWQELVRGDISHEDIDGKIPFDIINAIGFFLKDEGNKNLPNNSYDIHNRLIFSKSYQCTNNIAGTPIINIYINFIKSLLNRTFNAEGLSLWPHNKICAIGLSHDVDDPDKYEILKSPFYIKKYNTLENVKHNFFRLKVLRNRLLDKNPNDFWLFPEILEHEEKLGFRSTFFFASANKFQKYGSDFDVDYDINKQNYRKLIREIKGHEFEVSLHASYNAFLDPNRLLSEKNKLERVSGCKIRGLRHHYWHMNKNVENTLEYHEHCGFEYDTSIAFNDELGFRRNIALPYYPWSDVLSRPINVVQLPVFCMDGNLFYKPIEAGDAVEKLNGYIETIKKNGGLGVIDWHDRTSYPKNNEFWDWGEVYIGTLNYLHKNPDIWVTNLGSITSWIKKREYILKHN